MPQWDFLDFIAGEARQLPAFELRMRAEVTGLIEEGGRVVGVRGPSPDGGFEIRADCAVGCDGRHSTVRAAAGLPSRTSARRSTCSGFASRRDPAEHDNSLARVAPGHFVVTIDRGDYWQCAFVIAKGGAAELQRRRSRRSAPQVVAAVPMLAPTSDDVRSWDDVKLLTVASTA